MEQIVENLKRVQEAIGEAEQKAGRPQGSVKLIAVTKTLGEEKILPALRAGVGRIGENRVQELAQKEELFSAVEKHLIGQLQSNKAKKAVQLADYIHAVDRISLASELEKACESLDKTAKVFIQVNVGREPQKGGVLPEDLDRLCDAMVPLKRLQVQGLMTVPPAVGNDSVRKYFAQLRELSEKLRARLPGFSLGELSMGMSGDFIHAIAEGATYVRIGTSIFGKRS